jgi:hypothetical protein
MKNTGKLLLSAGLVLGLLAIGSESQAMYLINAGTNCRPGAVTGFGDLDFDQHGAMQIKANATTKNVVCGISRQPVTGNDVSYSIYMDFYQQNNQRISMAYYATNYTGVPLGSWSVDTSAGNGWSFRGTTLPAAALPTYGYLAVWGDVPGNKNARISYIMSNY